MANPLRFGIEIEYQAIRFTLRRRNDGLFWPLPPDGTLKENTMIGLEPMLRPLDVGAGFLNGAAVNWESDWGFRAGGDAFAEDTFIVGGVSQNAVSTVLELATAAVPVTDAAYWITARKCSEKFLEAINDFQPANFAALPPGTLPLPAAPVQPFLETRCNVTCVPIQTFIDYYNAKLTALAATPNGVPGGININRFKLAKAQGLVDFEAGNRAGFLGQHWDAFVCFRGEVKDMYCDVQVNYQISLRSLYTNLNDWVTMWNSVWIQRYGALPNAVDPPVGDPKPVAESDPVWTQYFAAMWRRARQLVDDPNFLGAQPGVAAWNALGPDASLLKALVMYVLVCSCITNPPPPPGQQQTDTSKNRYPQLCKTSPQSIKAAINALLGAPAANYWPALQAVGVAPHAQAAFDLLRAPVSLVNSGCLDGNAGVTAIAGRYVDYIPGILTLPNPPFLQMWAGSLADHAPPLGVLAAANKFGYVNVAPFHCRWADGVHSSYQAQVHNGNDIKILFESRPGRCMANIGFNPFVSGFLFNRSYLRIVRALAGAGQVVALAPLVNAHFPDNPAIQQDFATGHH